MDEPQAALVEANLDLAELLAAKLYPRFRGRIEYDDLVQAGVEGLMDAALRYDPGREASFRTFANSRVHGAIIDETRRACAGYREPDPDSTNYNSRWVYASAWLDINTHKHQLFEAPTPEDIVVEALYPPQLLAGIRQAAQKWTRAERATLEWILTGTDSARDFARREGVTESAIAHRRRKVEAKLRVLLNELMAA